MPRQFNKAQDVWMHDTQGGRYLDFLSGCSTLNYGHNHPVLKTALMDYIANDGVTHGLDLHTDAKEDFLTTLEDVILTPRGLDYRAMFTGPTGTNVCDVTLAIFSLMALHLAFHVSELRSKSTPMSATVWSGITKVLMQRERVECGGVL